MVADVTQSIQDNAQRDATCPLAVLLADGYAQRCRGNAYFGTKRIAKEADATPDGFAECTSDKLADEACSEAPDPLVAERLQAVTKPVPLGVRESSCLELVC